MKAIRFAAAFTLLLLCSSCVPLASFYPLWDQDHAAVVPGLEGTWLDSDGGTLKMVTVAAGQYAATYTDEDGVSQYEVHTVALGGKFYLDFYPDEKAVEKLLKGTAYFSLVPAHFFARIEVAGDSLQLALLDDDKVEKRAQKGDLVIPLLKRGDQYLLTAETAPLQRLMEQFADDPSVWGENETFTRKNGAL